MNFSSCHIDVIGVTREEGRHEVALRLKVDLRCFVRVCVGEEQLENESVAFVLPKKHSNFHFHFNCRICGYDLTNSLHGLIEVLSGLLSKHVSHLCDSDYAQVACVPHFFVCLQVGS